MKAIDLRYELEDRAHRLLRPREETFAGVCSDCGVVFKCEVKKWSRRSPDPDVRGVHECGGENVEIQMVAPRRAWWCRFLLRFFPKPVHQVQDTFTPTAGTMLGPTDTGGGWTNHGPSDH